MRKQFTILLCALCALLSAQSIPVTIIETAPEVVCAGDSVDVRFVTSAPIMPNQTFQVAMRMDWGSFTVIDTIFTGVLSDLAVVDTINIGIVYSTRARIPTYCPIGTWYASGNIFSPRQVSMVVKSCAKNPIHIISASKDTICPGQDSICVTIVNPFGDPFYFNLETPMLLRWYEVYPQPGDGDTTTYCFEVTADVGLGNGFLGINLESDSNFAVVFWCPPGTGISEVPPPDAKIIYRTLDLLPTALRPNAILFQEWTLPDGSVKRRKIIMQE